MLSSDVRLALSPAATYRQLLRERPDAGWLTALGRPAFVAVLLGTVMSIAAAGRVTLSLVAAETLAWSFAPAVQMLAGAVMIASVPMRPVSVPRAMYLLFLGHVPWSLWLLAVAAMVTLTTPPFRIELTAALVLVPFVWTIVILNAFCRTVLETSRRGASLRVAAHQAIIWIFVIAYIFAVSGMWARLLEAIGR